MCFASCLLIKIYTWEFIPYVECDNEQSARHRCLFSVPLSLCLLAGGYIRGEKCCEDSVTLCNSLWTYLVMFCVAVDNWQNVMNSTDDLSLRYFYCSQN